MCSVSRNVDEKIWCYPANQGPDQSVLEVPNQLPNQALKTGKTKKATKYTEYSLAAFPPHFTTALNFGWGIPLVSSKTLFFQVPRI